MHQERLIIEAKGKAVGTAWRAFLVRRSFRIFPIYYLTLSVLAFLAFLHIFRIDWNTLGHIFHIFYLTNVWNFLQKPGLGIYGHLWTLSVEEQFYLIAAPLLLYSPARMHIAICTTIVGGELIWHEAMGLSWHLGPIALGGVAALACKQDKWRLGGDALLALAMGSFAMTWATLEMAPWLVDTLTASWSGGVVPVLAVFIVILVFTSQNGFIVRALEWKPLAHLGRISYGFYLYHNFIGFRLFENSDLYHRVVTHLIEFVVVFILAELSWHLIERPLISFARARTDVRSAEPYYQFPSAQRAA